MRLKQRSAELEQVPLATSLESQTPRNCCVRGLPSGHGPIQLDACVRGPADGTGAVCVMQERAVTTSLSFRSSRVIPILSLLALPVGVGMKLTDVGIATLAKG